MEWLKERRLDEPWTFFVYHRNVLVVQLVGQVVSLAALYLTLNDITQPPYAPESAAVNALCPNPEQANG